MAIRLDQRRAGPGRHVRYRVRRLRLASAPLETGAGNGDHFNVVANAPGGSYYAAGYVIKAASGNQADGGGQADARRRSSTGPSASAAWRIVDHRRDRRATVEQGRGDRGPVRRQDRHRSATRAPTRADSDIYVARFTTGGVIDGDVRRRRHAQGRPLDRRGDQAWGLIRRPDDRLVVVASRGTDGDGRTDRDYDFIGLTANGDLDPTWGGGDGIVTPPKATVAIDGTNYELNENPRGGTIQADGKILTAGYASGLRRARRRTVHAPVHLPPAAPTARPTRASAPTASRPIDLNGSTCRTRRSPTCSPSRATARSSASATASPATTANNNLLVARLTTDGKLDTTFATNGVFSYDAGPADRARNVVVTPDDKILVVGSTEIGAGSAQRPRHPAHQGRRARRVVRQRRRRRGRLRRHHRRAVRRSP